MRTFGQYRERNRCKALLTILRGVGFHVEYSPTPLEALWDCLRHPRYALTKAGTEYCQNMEKYDPWNDRIPAIRINRRYRRRYGKGFFVFMPSIPEEE